VIVYGSAVQVAACPICVRTPLTAGNGPDLTASCTEAAAACYGKPCHQVVRAATKPREDGGERR
jgi:hypothetical protein